MSELQKNNRNIYVSLDIQKQANTLFHENYIIKLFYDTCVMFAEISDKDYRKKYLEAIHFELNLSSVCKYL